MLCRIKLDVWITYSAHCCEVLYIGDCEDPLDCVSAIIEGDFSILTFSEVIVDIFRHYPDIFRHKSDIQYIIFQHIIFIFRQNIAISYIPTQIQHIPVILKVAISF